MENEKDRFGDAMRLVEKAKEDIYFAEHDRELLEKLRAQLRKVDRTERVLGCPKCPGKLESYVFEEIAWIAVTSAVASGWIKGNWNRS